MSTQFPAGINVTWGISKRLDHGTNIQSIAFDKNLWTISSAKTWLHKHGFYFGYPHETLNFWRFRQHDPTSHERYRTSKNPQHLSRHSIVSQIADEIIDKLGNFPLNSAELDDAMEFVYNELDKRRELSDADKDKICFIIEDQLMDYIADISGE